MHAGLLYLLSIASHVFVLSLISVRRWQLSRVPPVTSVKPSPGTIKLTGTIVALATLLLPYAGPHEPFQQCGVRVACFFYAFKLLDLALTKAVDPPKLVLAAAWRHSTFLDHVRYAWLLLTGMRYHDFDIGAVQKGRRVESSAEKAAGTLLPPLLIGVATFAFPVTEAKCAALLCLIQHALEGIHTLLHPRCPHSLFYRPFAAAALGDFWAVHWHASAVFLHSLAYRPARGLIGRPFGVLAAFALSGVWHGWAAASLVDDAYAVRLGLQVCVFFVMLGVGTLLERMVWRDRKGGWLQRVLVWAWSLVWAGWCFRTLECHSKIVVLRNEQCVE